MPTALKLENLRKKQSRFELGPIHLEVEQGSAMGLIGPNGAGKSTLISCLLGLTTPDQGSMTVLGHKIDPSSASWKHEVGFVLNEKGFFERLTVAENIKFLSSFYLNWDPSFCNALLERLALDPLKKVKHLSTGDLGKLALIAAISHHPKLLILDEPTAGLDPVARESFVSIILEYLSTGENSVLMTSHILSDISSIADSVAFIDQGRIVSRHSKDDILDSWQKISFRTHLHDLELPGIIKSQREGLMHFVTTTDAERTLLSLRAANAEILSCNRLNLDEITVCILKGARA
jgi:ABC-2 type transport system ATP-binding protein